MYDTRYHLVWAPKYRKWVLRVAIRQRVRELRCQIAGPHRFEIEELAVDKDHVHLFLSVPPTYSISAMVGLLKAVSAKEIRGEFLEVRKHLCGGEFWEDGYFVRTVGDKVTTEVSRSTFGFMRRRREGLNNWTSSRKPRPERRDSLLRGCLL